FSRRLRALCRGSRSGCSVAPRLSQSALALPCGSCILVVSRGCLLRAIHGIGCRNGHLASLSGWVVAYARATSLRSGGAGASLSGGLRVFSNKNSQRRLWLDESP